MKHSAKTRNRKDIAIHSEMVRMHETEMRYWFSVRHDDERYEFCRTKFNEARKLRKYWMQHLVKSARRYSSLFSN